MARDTGDTHLATWWLPDAPRRRTTGRLTLPEGEAAVLELVEPLHLEDPQSRDVPVILGMTNRQIPITLLDSVNAGSDFPSSVPRDVFWPARVLVGAHFESNGQATFRRCRFELAGLREWLGPLDIAREVVGNGIRLTVPGPSATTFTVGVGTITLRRGLGGRFARHELSYEDRAAVEVVAQEPLGIDEWLDRVVFPLRNLLTFATADPSNVEGVVFFGTSVGEEGSLEPAIDLIDRRITKRSGRDGKFRPYEMLFTFRDVETRIAEVLTCWLGASSTLRLVTGPFFSTVYTTEMFVEQRFLTLSRAIEAFHRIKYPEPEIPPREWNRIRGSAVTAVGEAHGDRVREALAHANEPNLRTRLHKTMSDLHPIFEALRIDLNTTVDAIVKARNALAHGLSGRFADHAEPRRLLALCSVLHAVVQACLLKELGFPVEQAAGRTQATKEFARGTQWCAALRT